jgi:signal transduction histidine kinase
MTKQKTASFYRKIRISLGLMGILPFMLVAWIFYEEGVHLSNTIIIYSTLILFLILMGFVILRQSADQLSLLVEEISSVKKSAFVNPIKVNIDGELKEIAGDFNTLVNRLNTAHYDI